MSGEPELKGLAKHFNSVTFTGRANVAKVSSSCQKLYFTMCFPQATYAAILLTVVAVKAKNAMKG